MADFRLPPLDGGERLYRALLYCYPARFRRAFAQELVETFRDERRAAARAGVSRGAFWLATLHDVITHGLAERFATAARALRSDRAHEESPMAALSSALALTELRLAARRLRRAPTFALAATIVLALGVGATTAVFTVVNGVLLRPLPYPAWRQLVAIKYTVAVAGITTVDQSDAGLLYNQEHATAFEASGGWRDRSVNVARPAGDPGAPERVSAAAVTANIFDVLGVRPMIGRGFESGEDRAGAAPVVIVSHDLWQRVLHGDPAAIGKRLVVDGESREIVGVMPKDFVFIRSSPQLWYPERFDRETVGVGSFNYRSVARLRAGQTPATARADLARILPHMIEEFPRGVPPAMWEQAHVQPVVVPLRDDLIGDVSHLLWILLGSVSLVLAIACANVASLFLVRAEARQLELAVRGALGSGTVGMMTQALSESLVVCGVGGALGLALARIGLGLAKQFGGNVGLPRMEEVTIDGRVLLFALIASALCAGFVSLLPVLRARRIPIAMVLRAAGRGETSAAPRQRARSALVVAQMALALVLVAASGLLARSFARLREVRVGFDPHGVVMARLVLPEATYPSMASVVQFHDRLLDAVRALPGVKSATVSDWVPLTADQNTSVAEVQDHPLPPGALPRVHSMITIDGDYFRTMGIPLLRGRSLRPADPAHPSTDVVVSRAFAERYWPGGDAIGRRVRPGIDGPWFTVVGVAGDVHYDGLDQPPNEAMYLPLVSPDSTELGPPRYVALLVNAGAQSANIASAIRTIVRAADPLLPTYDEQPLDDVVASASARARLMLALLATASALALVLGAVGIYGVMAYGVTLRQREIGVRIALGAQPGEVSRMISQQGVRLALAGVVIGLACSLIVTRLLRGLLYEVSPTDPLTLALTCAVLLAVALLASWLPARRAAAIDPAQALRRG